MDKIMQMTLPILDGAGVTLELFLFAFIFVVPMGLLVALGRISKLKPLQISLEVYIWLMRGTPLMLQLLFVYFALPLAGIKLPDFVAALLAFTLNYTAYFAEIFRAGIQSIDRGQYEAAHILGMSYIQTIRRIIIPQMIRRVLPPMSNETINLVKDTSLIYILAMNDLLRAARTIVQREFDMTPFLVAAMFYLVMTFLLTWGFKRLEAYFGRYDA
jgi:polar amino acid transport system permease protein